MHNLLKSKFRMGTASLLPHSIIRASAAQMQRIKEWILPPAGKSYIVIFQIGKDKGQERRIMAHFIIYHLPFAIFRSLLVTYNHYSIYMCRCYKE